MHSPAIRHVREGTTSHGESAIRQKLEKIQLTPVMSRLPHDFAELPRYLEMLCGFRIQCDVFCQAQILINYSLSNYLLVLFYFFYPTLC